MVEIETTLLEITAKSHNIIIRVNYQEHQFIDKDHILGDYSKLISNNDQSQLLRTPTGRHRPHYWRLHQTHII